MLRGEAPLVGRDVELEALIDAVAAARGGDGGTTIILGAAGVGKTRLVREAAAAANALGLLALIGRSTQGPVRIPFRPLREAMAAAFRGGAIVDEAALAPFRAALSRLVPVWSGDVQQLLEDSLFATSEGTLRLLDQLAGERGLLLVLEDLQWADPETLSVLEYVADNLGRERVACLVTIRTGSWSAAADVAQRLRSRRRAILLELHPLDPPDVRALAESLTAAEVPDEAVDLLVGRTGGNPLLVEQLLAAVRETRTPDGPTSWKELIPELASRVPADFADSVRRRLDELGDEGRRLLQAAAILGRFDQELLAAVAAVDHDRVFSALRKSRDAELLGPEAAAATLAFKHALVRDAVLAELLPGERSRLAAAALDAADAAHPAVPGEWCGVAARLALEAGQERRAALLLLDQGRRSLAIGGLESAESALWRARAASGDDLALGADIDEALAHTLALAGKPDDVATVGERLRHTLEALNAPPSRRIDVERLIARSAVVADRWEQAHVHIEVANRLLPDADIDRRRRADLDVLAAHVSIARGDLDRADELARASLAAAHTAGTPATACEALEILGRCARMSDLDAAEDAFRRALQLAEDHGLGLWRIRALHELGTIDMMRWGARSRLREARDAALQAGALAVAATIEVQLGSVAMGFFEDEEGLASLRRSADIARRYHLDHLLAVALAKQAGCHALALRAQEVEAAIEEAFALAPDDPEVATNAWAYGRGVLALLEERRGDAVEALEMAMEYARRSPGTSRGWYGGLWALLRSLEDLDGEAACAEIVPLGPSEGLLQYAAAVRRGRMGDQDAAEAAVEAGHAAFRALGQDNAHMRHLALRLVAEAAISDGWGQPEQWLRQLVRFWGATRYRRVADACRALMRQSGIPVPRAGRGDSPVPAELVPLGVTSREMDVLRLVLDALTDRQIADRLYLSPRTVQTHVSNLLRKTGCSDRSQLAAVTRRMGLPG
ncbi:MAG: AAA family ATPase [Actinomycetota bacterium]|nr:AAA family ATPase [Actinomycetota bacterium]